VQQLTSAVFQVRRTVPSGWWEVKQQF
jgi:hypothetical protein